MSEIEFDADNRQQQFTSRAVLGQQQVPGMAAWLMKKGIIKDESKAGTILVGIVIFNIIVTAIVVAVFIF